MGLPDCPASTPPPFPWRTHSIGQLLKPAALQMRFANVETLTLSSMESLAVDFERMKNTAETNINAKPETTRNALALDKSVEFIQAPNLLLNNQLRYRLSRNVCAHQFLRDVVASSLLVRSNGSGPNVARPSAWCATHSKRSSATWPTPEVRCLADRGPRPP